ARGPLFLNFYQGKRCAPCISGYVNDYDQAVHFRCPGAGYINGMASYHHNYYEDRRHKFRCCGRRGSRGYYLTINDVIFINQNM
ncbi:hypothetical protein MHBO_003491, partial [Bonamia ostreae]